LALAVDGNKGTSLGFFADEWYELGGSSLAYKSAMHDVTTRSPELPDGSVL
jgi:hypothetical protein